VGTIKAHPFKYRKSLSKPGYNLGDLMSDLFILAIMPHAALKAQKVMKKALTLQSSKSLFSR
jgi:hypothetical protein